jgi:serine/threonine protein kinase
LHLDRLHELGIIHTDLELRNVFVDGQGRAVLGDFGTSLFIRGPTTGGVRFSPGMPLKLDEDSPMTPPEVRRVYVTLVDLVATDKGGTLVTALVDARMSPPGGRVGAGGCPPSAADGSTPTPDPYYGGATREA